MADMTKSGMGDLEITWAHDIETRDGKLTSDAQMVNAMVEKDSQGVCIVKRPGTFYYNPGGPTGVAQGSLFISGTLWWIVNDKLYEKWQSLRFRHTARSDCLWSCLLFGQRLPVWHLVFAQWDSDVADRGDNRYISVWKPHADGSGDGGA